MSEQTKAQSASQGSEQDDDDDDQEDEMLQQQKDQTSQIIETGSVTPTKGKYVIHCLTIVGQIEGHYILPPQNKTTKYEHVIPQLVAIQENPDIEGLIIILNTVGGDVEAGLAISELISGMKKPTVSLVLGGGHSIGVPLAVSARQSFIVPSATMTIHPVRMNGLVLGVPQTLSYFDKMQERIVRFVEDNSNITAKQFRHLMMNTGELVMDVGTVLDGAQAVDKGIIDHLGGLSDAIDCLYDLIEEDREKRKQEEDDQEEEKETLAQDKLDQSKRSQRNKAKVSAITPPSLPPQAVPLKHNGNKKSQRPLPRHRYAVAHASTKELNAVHKKLPQMIAQTLFGQAVSMHTNDGDEHTINKATNSNEPSQSHEKQASNRREGR